MSKRVRETLCSLITVMLLWSATAYANEGHQQPDIVTVGGGQGRDHNYDQVHVPTAVCVDSVRQTGTTFNQPLVVHFQEGSWKGQTVLFHLGETSLYLWDLNNTWSESYHVQSTHSWGYMTYAQQGSLPNSDDDVLYVTTGDKSILAFLVDDLLPDRPPHHSPHAKGTHLGQIPFPADEYPGVQGVVSAPLYLGDDPNGMDRVVFSLVPDRLVMVKGLARRPEGTSPQPIVQEFDGWDSGTPTLLEDLNRPIREVAQTLQSEGRDIEFAVTAGKYFYIFSASDITASVWNVETGAEVLSHLTRDHGKRLIYMVNSNGVLRVINFVSQREEKHTDAYTAFNNSGLSMDATNIYFGLRWTGSTSSGAPGSQNGTLVSIDRQTWQATTTQIPTSAPTGRSWVNVSPIIWTDPADPGRKLILAGDTGGTVTAWTPTGAPTPFFLNQGTSLAPANCADVETTSPPDINLATRTQLTNNPQRFDGSNAWINSQGITTEMTIYGGRLFAGYTHANPSQSSLVILRNATNLVLQDLQLDQPEPLRPNQTVTVKAKAMLEGDPFGAPKTTTLAVGWAGYAPKTHQITLSPFDPQEVTFELKVPTGVKEVQLMAALNPSLYQARHDHDAQRQLIPSTAQTVPPNLTPQWAAAAQTDQLGEAFVLDNARAQTLAVKGDDLAIKAFCPTGAVPGTYALPLVVSYAGAGTEAIRPQLRLRITGDASQTLTKDVQVVPNRQQPLPWRLDLDPGSYTVTASVVPPAGMVDEEPANNSTTCTLEILETCPDGMCGQGGTVLGP